MYCVLISILVTRCFLPLLNYDNLGRKVIIIRPGCFDPYLHRAQDIEKANFMVSDVMGLQDEQLFITGMVIIIDFSGYSFGHLTQRPLAVTKKWLQFLQVRKTYGKCDWWFVILICFISK